MLDTVKRKDRWVSRACRVMSRDQKQKSAKNGLKTEKCHPQNSSRCQISCARVAFGARITFQHLSLRCRRTNLPKSTCKQQSPPSTTPIRTAKTQINQHWTKNRFDLSPISESADSQLSFEHRMSFVPLTVVELQAFEV